MVQIPISRICAVALDQRPKTCAYSPAPCPLPKKGQLYSRMQFPPTVWGPFFWHTIHLVALGYPKNPNYTEKKCAKEFYESLAYLIPCAVCREHYKTHLAANPLTPSLDTKRDLLKWTIDIHNAVNKMLNTPQWTEMEVLAYYERLGRRDRSPVWTKEDMKEVDYHSFVKGFLSGTFVLAGIGGLVYFVQRLQS